MILNQQLKMLLQKHDITIAQLARATGISSKTIYQWIKNHKPRNIEQVKKVSDHFGVSLDFLIFGQTVETGAKEIKDYLEQIHLGQFEVILRQVKK